MMESAQQLVQRRLKIASSSMFKFRVILTFALVIFVTVFVIPQIHTPKDEGEITVFVDETPQKIPISFFPWKGTLASTLIVTILIGLLVYFLMLASSSNFGTNLREAVKRRRMNHPVSQYLWVYFTISILILIFATLMLTFFGTNLGFTFTVRQDGFNQTTQANDTNLWYFKDELPKEYQSLVHPDDCKGFHETTLYQIQTGPLTNLDDPMLAHCQESRMLQQKMEGKSLSELRTRYIILATGSCMISILLLTLYLQSVYIWVMSPLKKEIAIEQRRKEHDRATVDFDTPEMMANKSLFNKNKSKILGFSLIVLALYLIMSVIMHWSFVKVQDKVIETSLKITENNGNMTEMSLEYQPWMRPETPDPWSLWVGLVVIPTGIWFMVHLGYLIIYVTAEKVSKSNFFQFKLNGIICLVITGIIYLIVVMAANLTSDHYLVTDSSPQDWSTGYNSERSGWSRIATRPIMPDDLVYEYGSTTIPHGYCGSDRILLLGPEPDSSVADFTTVDGKSWQAICLETVYLEKITDNSGADDWIQIYGLTGSLLNITFVICLCIMLMYYGSKLDEISPSLHI